MENDLPPEFLLEGSSYGSLQKLTGGFPPLPTPMRILSNKVSPTSFPVISAKGFDHWKKDNFTSFPQKKRSSSEDEGARQIKPMKVERDQMVSLVEMEQKSPISNANTSASLGFSAFLPALRVPPCSYLPDSLLPQGYRKHLGAPSPFQLFNPRTEMNQRRPMNLSERVRRLDKLMPWERKLSMVATVEEASKYIEFLESQVKALSWMPVLGSLKVPKYSVVDNEFVVLEKLNRQQILEVMVNSGVVQEKLYTNGLCVVSAEQMEVLRNLKTA